LTSAGSGATLGGALVSTPSRQAVLESALMIVAWALVIFGLVTMFFF
jgi:hypothetical protein